MTEFGEFAVVPMTWLSDKPVSSRIRFEEDLDVVICFGFVDEENWVGVSLIPHGATTLSLEFVGVAMPISSQSATYSGDSVCAGSNCRAHYIMRICLLDLEICLHS